jgi:hypothetical protein
MNTQRRILHIVSAVLIAAPVVSGLCMAADLLPPNNSQQKAVCEDSIPSVATVKANLDCKFFKTTKFTHPWWIAVDADGNLEKTLGDRIEAEDLQQVELTAQCTSTHQGKHLMEYCSAVATADGVILVLEGGMPAYASSMTVTIDAKLHFTCSFEATYPAPTNPLRWRVTSKELSLKSTRLTPGTRMRAYVAVEFEEIDTTTKETHSYKIQGYLKPIIQSAPRDQPQNAEEQAGADQPATQPADKVPPKFQPSTPTSKDAPR